MSQRRTNREGPVLVAGGAGYIGAHAVKLLREHELPVVVLDDLSTGHRDALLADLVEGSLGDRDFLLRTFREHRPRAVMHFAARSLVGESVEHPARYYRDNGVNTWQLLEVMRETGCRRIVFSSTCATYGHPVRVPITEEHPQAPISPYGRTKLHIEHMIEDYAKAYDLSFSILRYFNAAGAAREGNLGEVHEPETHLIPLTLQVALGKRKEIQIFGDDYDTPDGTCIRDYIHVEDLADAHLRALERIEKEKAALVCNLGTGQGFSVLEVVETARRVTGHAIPARVVGRRPGDPERLVSGGKRARELLGWTPARIDIEDIVGDAWNFHHRHPDGYAD
jgi:UDP-glucose 4-epimerase